MTKPNKDLPVPAGDKQPDLFEQARIHLDEAARIGRELVKQATQPAYSVMEKAALDKATEEENERRNEAQWAVVSDFIHCLPCTSSKKTKKLNLRGEEYEEIDRKPVELEALEDAVLMRSVVWDVYGGLYYQIGKKLNSNYLSDPNDERYDTSARLLLYPADNCDNIVVLTLSSRKLDMIEELAITSLNDPIDSDYKLEPFLMTGGSFRVPRPVKRYSSGGFSIHYKLIDHPSDRKLKKIRSRLESDGIDADVDLTYTPSLQDFRDFGVPFHTLKLATTLGKTEAFDATIGLLKPEA